MAAVLLLAPADRSRRIHHPDPPRHIVTNRDLGLIGRDQLSEERRRRLKNRQHRTLRLLKGPW